MSENSTSTPIRPRNRKAKLALAVAVYLIYLSTLRLGLGLSYTGCAVWGLVVPYFAFMAAAILIPSARVAFGALTLIGGFAFLYMPIASLIVYSFSDSSIINDWTHFSLKWYDALFHDQRIGETLLTSLKVAAMSATGSVIIGTLAAYAMLRYSKFFGRKMFLALVNAPLVMPDVVVGLSLLLMIVSVQNAFDFEGGRNIYTILIGHMLVGTAYATVVVAARLRELNPQFEEAALDLGARPIQAFFLVTLPMVMQALGAAWLLTFTLSLDDVVIASFLSGPSSTTLPMEILSRAQRGLNPTVNALATVIIVVVSVCVAIAVYLIARREKRLWKEAARR